MFINSDELWSLDLETKSLDPNNPQYALEPFRARQNRATVTDISISGTDGYEYHSTNVNELTEAVWRLRGKVVYCHNTLFDVAWLIAHDVPMDVLRQVQWRDTMLLAKWHNNSQAAEFGGVSYSLGALIDRYFPDDPDAALFVRMKKEGDDIAAGENPEYWSRRAVLDTLWTVRLAAKLERSLPAAQHRGYIIESKCILPTANSWVVGLRLDRQRADEVENKVQGAMRNMSRELGLEETMISSPSQLSDFLFIDNGIKPMKYGKPNKRTGISRGSTSKEDLMQIHYRLVQGGELQKAELLKHVMDFKQLITLRNKYINGIKRTTDYTLDGRSHGAPRIFGTYTGRFTYSSQTLRKKNYQVGIAQHQVPRKGPTKSMISAPEGYTLSEFDASGQESRGMAIMSGDENMLDIFKQGKDFHSMTGSEISGRAYGEFVKAFNADEKDAVNQRYNGKFVNLSCNYRIGDNALQKKAFTQYGIVVDFYTAKSWNNGFKRMFPGVPDYWKRVCSDSKEKGYTETLSGRRYYLTEWNSHKWQTESSAINFPIQGFGGDMKYLAISEVFDKVPEAVYGLDVHDANFYFMPEGPEGREIHLEVFNVLQNLDYEEAWDCEIPIPLLWDGKNGPSWSELEILEK